MDCDVTGCKEEHNRWLTYSPEKLFGLDKNIEIVLVFCEKHFQKIKKKSLKFKETFE